MPFKGPALPCNPAWSEYTFFFFFFYTLVKRGKRKERKRWDYFGGRAASLEKNISRKYCVVQIFWREWLEMASDFS